MFPKRDMSFFARRKRKTYVAVTAHAYTGVERCCRCCCCCCRGWKLVVVVVVVVVHCAFPFSLMSLSCFVFIFGLMLSSREPSFRQNRTTQSVQHRLKTSFRQNHSGCDGGMLRIFKERFQLCVIDLG